MSEDPVGDLMNSLIEIFRVNECIGELLFI